MITFDQVSLQYDAKHTALSNINIHIDKGEFVFIVGPSGAGKSTFVKILTHELVPEQGTVVVNGLTINKLKSSKIPYYRRTLGIVFQAALRKDRIRKYCLCSSRYGGKEP